VRQSCPLPCPVEHRPGPHPARLSHFTSHAAPPARTPEGEQVLQQEQARPPPERPLEEESEEQSKAAAKAAGACACIRACVLESCQDSWQESCLQGGAIAIKLTCLPAEGRAYPHMPGCLAAQQTNALPGCAPRSQNPRMPGYATPPKQMRSMAVRHTHKTHACLDMPRPPNKCAPWLCDTHTHTHTHTTPTPHTLKCKTRRPGRADVHSLPRDAGLGRQQAPVRAPAPMGHAGRAAGVSSRVRVRIRGSCVCPCPPGPCGLRSES